MTDHPMFKCGTCLAMHEYNEAQLNRARQEIVRLEAELAAVVERNLAELSGRGSL